MLKTSILTLPFLFILFNAQAQHQQLRNTIDSIAHATSGKVGVAICLLETDDTLTYHNHEHYVMQSMFKFAIAMDVLHGVDQGKFRLDQPVHFSQADLRPTVSALRDKYPSGNVDVPLKEVLEDMVTTSDNNACDKLIQLLGGPNQVNRYLHGLGIKAIQVKVNEAQMAATWFAQYTNWCEPAAQVQLLSLLYHQTALRKASNDLLWQWMLHTYVGAKRIRGLLPEGTPVAHRTGTSATNDKGLSPGTNDVGIIVLPNGKHLAIAILLTDSYADMDAREAVIAKIARAAYNEFAK